MTTHSDVTIQKENPKDIDVDAARWVAKVNNPDTTREELGRLDVWLLDPAHAVSFENYMAPIELKTAKELSDAGLDWPTDA